MKKILSAFVAFALAFVAAAELDTLISFSTKGPDKYLDGKTVVNGECYALVWVKSGCEFKGLNADGTCVDPVNNALVLAAPVAKDGKCPSVMYVVRAADASRYEGGEYGIYLLDTRKTDGSVDADGNVIYTAAGVTAAGVPAAVNGYGAVAAGITAADGSLASASSSSGVSVAAVAAPPADAPNPKITAIKIIGDNVFLTVADTVSYLQYNVASGETPASQSGAAAAAPKNGVDGEEITLVVPKGDKKFFKVRRN